MSKLILLNFADLQFSQYFETNQYLFRRSLLLIKAWCLYEGCIVGSNVGLLASYAVEVLGIPKLAAITTLENFASMAVLRKIGFTYQGVIQVPGVDRENTYFTTG